MALRCLFSLLKAAVIIGILVFCIHVWLNTKSYLFTEDAVATIAKKHKAGSDPKRAYAKIHQEFYKTYPGHILPKEDLRWIFMNAGGWMGSMCIIHASPTEYVLFFGAAIDTTGHSGRYWANISDTVLTGEFKQWKEGELSVHTYKPGDTVLHVWGEVTAVHFKAGTWMVEYGRGFIPSTLGFALSDTLFSTQDVVTLFHILRVYAKAMWLEAGTLLANLL